MKFRNDLSAEYVRSMLDYDSSTGILRWKVGFGEKRQVGGIAGSIRNGHRVVYLQRKAYFSARLVWLIMTGEWPPILVDHADQDSLNDRWENLRSATHGQNRANCFAYSTNKLGLKGANRVESGKFRAVIQDHGRIRHLGLFDTAEEANARYFEEAQKLHGEFARRI